MPRSAVTKASVNDIKTRQRDFDRSQRAACAGEAFEDQPDTAIVLIVDSYTFSIIRLARACCRAEAGVG